MYEKHIISRRPGTYTRMAKSKVGIVQSRREFRYKIRPAKYRYDVNEIPKWVKILSETVAFCSVSRNGEFNFTKETYNSIPLLWNYSPEELSVYSIFKIPPRQTSYTNVESLKGTFTSVNKGRVEQVV